MGYINTVTNTGITNKSYTSRGLITHRSNTNNLVRASDGTLWVATRERHRLGHLNLYRSVDNGFSWQTVFRGSWPTGLGWGTEIDILSGRTNGPFISLQLFESLGKIVVWQAFQFGGTEYRAWPFIFDTNTGTRVLDEVPSNYGGYQVVADDISIKFAYNENMVYMVYTKSDNLHVKTFHPAQLTADRTDSNTTGVSYLSDFDATARADGYVDIAIARYTERLDYVRYNDATLSFTSNQIAQAVGRVIDINIVRDGQGNLLCLWGDVEGLNVVSLWASISTDNGASWTHHFVNTGTTYVDEIQTESATRAAALAGIDGFLISYTYVDEGVPKTFVRSLSSNGNLGTESQIAQDEDRPVVGAKFFKAPAAKLMDLESPSFARVAFQVGEGNSATGADTTPVRLAQELLSESAFPSFIAKPTPAPDAPNNNQAVVALFIHPGVSANFDSYAADLTGRYTENTLAAFKKVGTAMQISRYEPTLAAEVNDRSAYGAANTQTLHCIVTPLSYEMPLANFQDNFQVFIERDVRRIYIPATLHLERNIILNRGNFLKRTIWTVLVGGNEYEISQVVPYFIAGQLTHYAANAYVIGPSNDPFSRKTLPSET